KVETNDTNLLSVLNSKNKTNNYIPLNLPLPPGIIYKIQIAALKNLVTSEKFNISPVTAEKSIDNQFINYMYGEYYSYDSALVSKNALVNNGYPDAFIVAYIDGKRVSLSEAINKEAKILNNNKINNIQIITKSPSINDTSSIPNISTIKGLFYTIQIGVFGSPRSQSRLFNLNPLYYEKMNNGNYRYLAGVYNNKQEAITTKNQIAKAIVPDAFVVAYYNGKRISLQEAALLEKENTEKATTQALINFQIIPSPSEKLAAETKIEFKVQIGAFKKEISEKTLQQFKQICNNEDITFYINKSNLICYTAGSFASRTEAQTLRRKVINSGIPDAFIVAFSNNIPITLREAESLLKNNY
ncbi:MAG TPA: SPOR domain-containing protein, partial [Bacteroidales bacterium]|nr:SPOR domain-containing protein [Bacteroidales bacterium]